MLQNLQAWLPRLFIVMQCIFGLGIAYAIASTGLVLLGDSSETSPHLQAQTTSNAAQENLSPAPSLDDLTARNLFGSASLTVARSSSAPAVPTRLPLTLDAVFVSSDSEQSTAIISQRGNSGKLYSQGDMLPGSARLAEIEAERVILTRAGAREALTFKTTFRAKQGAPYIQSSQRLPTLNNTKGLSTSSLAIQRLTTELAQSPGETLQRIGVSQESDGGYRIGDTANQPFLAQSGLLPGDIVLSVNGRKPGDINVDRMALTNLANRGSVSLELLRNVQKLTITTRVPESLR